MQARLAQTRARLRIIVSETLLKKTYLLQIIGLMLVACCARAETPETILAGFEKRVEATFRAEAGKPLKRAKKNPPLKPGRGNYVRGYSYSMVAFAARCFYLGEQLPAANAALVENAQHYLDNPKDVNDRDSFHWHQSKL